MGLKRLTPAVLILLPLLAAAEPMRCGQWVVDEDHDAVSIRAKCGAPQRSDVSREDLLGKNANDQPIKLGVQVTEHWYYQLSPGAFLMKVTIIDGQVKSIERAQ